LVGHGADPLAIEVGRNHGLDLANHKARQIDFGMLEEFDLILTMELAHRNHLISIAPWATGKIWRWGHHETFDVPDPYRNGIDQFRNSFAIISRLGQNWLNLLKAL
jgi:protein-tyrosine phosphatase